MLKKLLISGVLSIFAVGIVVIHGAHAMDAAAFKSDPQAVAFAPKVPAPIKRRRSKTIRVHLNSSIKRADLGDGYQYDYWTFNGHVPGPIIRARVGDTLEILHTNSDPTGMVHNVDFHAVTGPGGGATVTLVAPGEAKLARFKLLNPGIFIYHCAAPPIPAHIANGMYGLILVEPKGGLRKVDREFYVLQSEFYTEAPEKGSKVLTFSHENGSMEHPSYVVFNGHKGALLNGGALKAKVGETVRIFFGNAGPNLISSFHVIGEIFDRLYREGDLISKPAQSVQTTLVPAGGATAVEFQVQVPGTFTLVDHAIFRIEKGAVGYLQVEGKERPDIFWSREEPLSCEGCEVHP